MVRYYSCANCHSHWRKRVMLSSDGKCILCKEIEIRAERMATAQKRRWW